MALKLAKIRGHSRKYKTKGMAGDNRMPSEFICYLWFVINVAELRMLT